MEGGWGRRAREEEGLLGFMGLLEYGGGGGRWEANEEEEEEEYKCTIEEKRKRIC